MQDYEGLRRRAAVEPIIGHAKSDGLLERNRLAGARGDAVNAVLVGAGHNIRLMLAWLRGFFCTCFCPTRRRNRSRHFSQVHAARAGRREIAFFADD
jgi:hypothetical protein